MDENHLRARLDDVCEKFKHANEHYSELERDEGVMQDVGYYLWGSTTFGTESRMSLSSFHFLQLVNVTTIHLQAQEEVLKLLTEQKKIFESHAAKATWLTAADRRK